MRICRPILLLLSASFAAPAGAEPLGPVASCMFDGFSRAERLVLADAVNASVPVSRAVEASFNSHSEACARRLSVSGSNLDLGLAEFVGAISIELLTPRLADAGFPVEVIDSWYDRQSEETRMNLHFGVNSQQADALGFPLLDALAARGVRIPMPPAQTLLLSRYLTAKMTLARAQRGLPFIEAPAE